MTKFPLILTLLAGLSLAACADNRVVLLADPDGHVGKLEISTRAGRQILDQAKTASSVADAGSAPSAPEAISDRIIADVWGEALSAQPPRPQTTLLYFKTGGIELREDSERELPRLVALLREWSHPRVLVVGHADATGSDEINVRLSRDRAAMVRDRLVSQGIPADVIEVNSHGKRNPLVETPDGVPEPRNRRVSVTVQ